jgi:hypothetical protein
VANQALVVVEESVRNRRTIDKKPLYEIVIRSYKNEMSKCIYDRNINLISALQKVQVIYSKYWRKTTKYPSCNIAASVIADEIQRLSKSLSRPMNYEKKENIREQIEYLKTYIDNFDYQYEDVDVSMVNGTNTNVTWELYHNPKNITVEDKQQLKKL